MASEQSADRIGQYLGAVYYTGNHASVEGFEAPSNHAIHRIVSPETDQSGGDAGAE